MLTDTTEKIILLSSKFEEGWAEQITLVHAQLYRVFTV